MFFKFQIKIFKHLCYTEKIFNRGEKSCTLNIMSQYNAQCQEIKQALARENLDHSEIHTVVSSQGKNVISKGQHFLLFYYINNIKWYLYCIVVFDYSTFQINFMFPENANSINDKYWDLSNFCSFCMSLQNISCIDKQSLYDKSIKVYTLKNIINFTSIYQMFLS